jgi:hypothetical protein
MVDGVRPGLGSEDDLTWLWDVGEIDHGKRGISVNVDIVTGGGWIAANGE